MAKSSADVEEEARRLRKRKFGHSAEGEKDQQTGEAVEPEAVQNEKREKRKGKIGDNPQSGSISVILTDPEVFDCSICFEPLSIPVFQCENGHISCRPCCTKIKNKCPSCSLPIGNSRCRAVEKVLESVKLSCSYKELGCNETVKFSQKRDHEKACIYAPCSCLFPNCNYLGSLKQLSTHIVSTHSSFVKCFRYNRKFIFSFNMTTTSYILQEEIKGDLFVIHNSIELAGNAVSISCVKPSNLKGGCFYEIQAETKGSSLRLQSFTRIVHGSVDDHPATGFLLVPCDFLTCPQLLKLKVCIWEEGACPRSIQRSIDVI